MYYLPVITVLASYLLLVRALRYRRRDDIQRRFPYKTREEMASMSLSEASAIFLELSEKEFPQIFESSLSFALFKTYGIPTISKLLVATSELSGEATASKRRTDTGVLMYEIMFNKPDCPRSIDAISRVNFLHDRWRKAGRISNDDMLYTLSLFVLEPVRWVRRLEWRDLERNAIAVYWKDLGNEMDISYDVLVPYMNQKNDPLAWLEALEIWSVKYQDECMVHSVTNEKLAHANVYLLLLDAPKFLHSFIFAQMRCVMETQLRHSMGYEDPSSLQFSIFNSLASARRWILKHLCLPRPKWWVNRSLTEADKKTGRFFLVYYMAHPWYIKPTFWSRWGPGAIYTRLIGGALPGDEGGKYHPVGYLISEVGPESQRGKGEDQMNTTRERIGKARGCTMAIHV